jgi:hypothetical protein
MLDNFTTKALRQAGLDPLDIDQAQALLLEGRTVMTHYGLYYRLRGGFMESCSKHRPWTRDHHGSLLGHEVPFILMEDDQVDPSRASMFIDDVGVYMKPQRFGYVQRLFERIEPSASAP